MNTASILKLTILLLYAVLVCVFGQSDFLGNDEIRFLWSLFLPISIVILSLFLFKKTIKSSLPFLATLFFLNIVYTFLQKLFGLFDFLTPISIISEFDFTEDIELVLILLLATLLYYALSAIQFLPLIFKKQFFIPRRILVAFFIVSLFLSFLLPLSTPHWHRPESLERPLSLFGDYTVSFFSLVVEIRIKSENIRIYIDSFLLALALNYKYILIRDKTLKSSLQIKELMQFSNNNRKTLIPLALLFTTLIFFLFVFVGEKKYNLQIPKELNENKPIALGDSFEKISKYTRLQRYTYHDGLSKKAKYFDTYYSDRASFNFDNNNNLKDLSLDVYNKDSLHKVEFYKKNFHILKKYYGNNFKIYRDKRNLSRLIFLWKVHDEYIVFMEGFDKKSENPLDDDTFIRVNFNQYFYLEDHVLTTNETLQSLGFE